MQKTKAERKQTLCKVFCLKCINRKQAASYLYSHYASVKRKTAICEVKEKLVQKDTVRLLLFMMIHTIFKEQTLKKKY